MQKEYPPDQPFTKRISVVHKLETEKTEITQIQRLLTG